jgi:hypothetical protein
MLTIPEPTLTPSKRGYAVLIDDVLYGWVQATPDDGWQAIDVDGRKRVAHMWNRREAARRLLSLVYRNV